MMKAICKTPSIEAKKKLLTVEENIEVGTTVEVGQEVEDRGRCGGTARIIPT
jgi:hypothetical protein